MCTGLLPPGANPIAVKILIIIIIIISSRGEPTRDCPPAWGLGEVLTAPYRKNVSCYEIFTQKAQDRDRWRGVVNAVMNSPVP